MDMTQIQPQDFGRLEGKIDGMAEKLDEMHKSGSYLARANQINIRWVWLSVVTLGGIVAKLLCHVFIKNGGNV